MTSSRSLISKWLVESRVLAGLSRPEAAAAIGISPKQLERLELGHHQPKAEYILKLARLYKVDVPGTSNGDNNVPRGTSEHHEPAQLTNVARDFEVEMIQAGATRFEADHIRQRLSAFWTAPLYEAGNTVASLTPEEQEREFRLYMEHSLRPWVMQRIADRAAAAKAKGAKPKK